MEINRARLPVADRLGEIVNPAAISSYFTKPTAAGRLRGVYFYPISSVFPFIISRSNAEFISIDFHSISAFYKQALIISQ